jgi:hypothetical protein
MSSAFDSAFGRFLTLLLRQSPVDTQYTVLRSCVAATRDAGAVLSPSADGLRVDGYLTTDPGNTQELNLRLLGHGVASVSVAMGCEPAELVALAWGLAAEPDPTQLGTSVRLMMLASPTRSVHVEFGPTGADVPGLLPPTPPRRVSTPISVAVVTPMDVELQRSIVSYTATTVVPDSLDAIFQRLQKVHTTVDGSPVLDAFIAYGDACVEDRRHTDLVTFLRSVVEHEAHESHRERKVLLSSVLRRFGSTLALGRVTGQLVGDQAREALTVLIAYGTSGADAVIEALVAAQLKRHRQAYLAALREMPVATSTVQHMLADGRWYIIRNAAFLIGELRIAELGDQLVALRAHPDGRARAAVLVALGKLGTPRAVSALQMGLRDPSSEVRDQAAQALGALPAGRAVPIAQHALRTESDDTVRASLLLALGRAGTEEAIRHLEEAARPGGKLIGRKPVAVRRAAVLALLASENPFAQVILAELRHDADPEIRAAASTPPPRRATVVTPLGAVAIDG